MPFRPKERKINCNEWPFYEWEKYAVNRKANFLKFHFYKKSAPYTDMFEAKSVIISSSQFQSDDVQALFCLQLNILFLFTYLHSNSHFFVWYSFQQFEPAVCYIFTLDFCLFALLSRLQDVDCPVLRTILPLVITWNTWVVTFFDSYSLFMSSTGCHLRIY